MLINTKGMNDDEVVAKMIQKTKNFFDKNINAFVYFRLINKDKIKVTFER